MAEDGVVVVVDDDGPDASLTCDGQVFHPDVVLAVGERRTIKGAAKDPYIQKRRQGDFYSCTCPSWRNLARMEQQRSCAHLRTLLGEQFEQARVRAAQLQNGNSGSGSTSKRLSSLKRTASNESAPSQGGTSTPPIEGSGSTLQPPSTPRSKRTRTTVLHGQYNERHNGGPRDLNGGSPLLLATKWPATRDPTGYWLTEKLDGVRAWWDGARMYSRTGRAWNPPEWFRDRLPKDLHLDGELWMRRDAFDRTSGICRQADPEGWRIINFMVFDATNLPLLLYEERLAELKKRLPDGEKSPDEVQTARMGGLTCVLPAVKCTGRTHFATHLESILSKGGEGLMLRRPRTAYEVGRGKTLYKHKVWYDAEGLVIGHEWGQGEHKGRMGAVSVKMESGHVLSVGSGFSHAQRDAWQPPVGAIIRYRFQDLSHDGFPRFPIYEGTCPDKTKPCDAIVRSTALRATMQKSRSESSFRDL